MIGIIPQIVLWIISFILHKNLMQKPKLRKIKQLVQVLMLMSG